MPKEDQDKIKDIVYLTDKFCIGEAAYHELTLSCGGGGGSLPRSDLLRQSKNQLNERIHIQRTPGTAEGAQLDFESELQNTIRKLAKEDQDTIKDIVYLTDKFCIGEAAYHELALACGGGGGGST